MIVDKLTHQFDFKKTKSTFNDPFANSVVLNTNLANQRSLTNDSLAPYVTLNLRFDQLANSYFFADDCGNLVTRSGTPYATTIDGRSCCYFDGVDDYLLIDYSSELSFNRVDFTIEMWVWCSSTTVSSACLLDFRGSTAGYNNWAVNIYPLSNRYLAVWDGSVGNPGAWIAQSPNAIFNTNTWFHFALCSISNVLYMYVNGVLVSYQSWVTPITNTGGIRIGNNAATDYDFKGYLSDIRITRGVSRYTGNFTPPSSIPEITPKGPRISDQILGDVYSMGGQGPSYENTSGPFGGPALYFNGSTFLTIPYHKYFDLNDQTSPFTLELWFKISKNAALTAGNAREMALISFSWPNASPLNNAISFRISGDLNNSGTRTAL